MLLACLLAGELLSTALGLPLPGAVLGMALLALGLGWWRRRGAYPSVERAADGLLEHLPLLFVPAGVGVMQFWPTLRTSWLPVVVTLVVGTALAMTVTAFTLKACLALQARRSGPRA